MNEADLAGRETQGYTEIDTRLCYLVDIDIVGVIHDMRGVLGEQLIDHGAVGLAHDISHGVLQHLMQL